MNENTLSQLDESHKSVVQLFSNYVTVLKDYSRELLFFLILPYSIHPKHIWQKSHSIKDRKWKLHCDRKIFTWETFSSFFIPIWLENIVNYQKTLMILSIVDIFNISHSKICESNQATDIFFPLSLQLLSDLNINRDT